MAKIYDLEKEKQKAKERAKEAHPFMCLRSKDGKFSIYPKWEKGPDGEWCIKNPEAIKGFLEEYRKETDKKGEPDGS